MQVVNYSFARKNLKKIIDSVCTLDEKYIITSKNNQIKQDIKASLREIKNNDFYDINEVFDRVISKYED